MSKNTNNQKEAIKICLMKAAKNNSLTGNEGSIITAGAKYLGVSNEVILTAALELAVASLKRPNSTIPFRKNHHNQLSLQKNFEEKKKNTDNIRPNNFFKGKKNDNHDVKRFATDNTRTQYKYVAKKSTQQNQDIINQILKKPIEEEKFESEFNLAEETNAKAKRFTIDNTRAQYEYVAKKSTQQTPDVIKPSLKKPIKLKPIEEETLESEINFADETNARAKNTKPIAKVTSPARKTTEDNNIILQNYNVTNKITPQIKKTKPAKNKTITLTEEEKAKKEEQRKADQARNQKREEDLKKLAEEKAKFESSKQQTKTKVKNAKQKVEKKNDIIDDQSVDIMLESLIKEERQNKASHIKSNIHGLIDKYMPNSTDSYEKKELIYSSFQMLNSEAFLESVVKNSKGCIKPAKKNFDIDTYSCKYTLNLESKNLNTDNIYYDKEVAENSIKNLLLLWQFFLHKWFGDQIETINFIDTILFCNPLEAVEKKDADEYCLYALKLFNDKDYEVYSKKVEFKCLVDILIYLYESSIDEMSMLPEDTSRQDMYMYLYEISMDEIPILPKDTSRQDVFNLIREKIKSHKSDAEIIPQNDEIANKIIPASKKKKKKKDTKKIDDNKPSKQEELKESDKNTKKIPDFKNLDTPPAEDWSSKNVEEYIKEYDSKYIFDNTLD